MTVFQLIFKMVNVHWTELGKWAFPGLFQNVYLSNVFWQKMPLWIKQLFLRSVCFQHEISDVYWSFSAKSRKFIFSCFFFFFFLSKRFFFLWEKKKTLFSAAVVHSLFQMEKSLNNVILKNQTLCEHWKPLVGSWLDRFDSCLSHGFTPCHGRDQKKTGHVWNL